MRTSSLEQRVAYPSLVLVCVVVSLLAGWSSYAHRINHIFSDLFFRQRGPQPPSASVLIVGIDDATLAQSGGLPLDRSLLARGLRILRESHPRLIAIDLLLTDAAARESDQELERALAGAPPEDPRAPREDRTAEPGEGAGAFPLPIVLATALEAGNGGRWLLPLPAFARSAAAIGHVHADPDGDGVSRQVLLEKQGAQQRHWALALECFRLWHGASAEPVTETDEALEVASGHGAAQDKRLAPAARSEQRALLINYAGGNGTFPQTSFADLGKDPALPSRLRDKIVLVGVTAQGTGDRLFTPFSSGVGMPGVEIHAHILHTLLTGNYLRPAGDLEVALAVLAITAMTLLVLAQLHGLAQFFGLLSLGGMVLLVPYGLFLEGQVWPAFSLLLSFGTALLAGEAYQLLVARKQFRESEARRKQSRQQFEMATHEMRTPLAAIQASSELLARYSLQDARREQMVQLLYEESQRLGRLVERFLSVERLSAGEMELRRVAVHLPSCLSAIVERLRPVADRKGVQLVCETPGEEIQIEADPELLEFAVSNLLTNAVKYSPPGTAVRLAWQRDGERAQIHIADSGPGIAPEQRRRIFERFYRTESAERSEAPGFGLGLAIAREIARHHGGKVRVETQPGAGSRFTILLPVKASQFSKPL